MEFGVPHRARIAFPLLVFPLLALSTSLAGQTSPASPQFSAAPRDRITGFIDDQQRVVLRGNLHPLARPENQTGALPPDYAMEHMVLILKPDSAQQSALDGLVEAQHNPSSPYYHQWLTPKTYGARFGVSENDLQQVENWLETQGMNVDEVTASRRAIVFSGTAGQVESAFHTQMRAYRVAGKQYHANASDPEIPLAMANVVGGVVSLHDFRSEPSHAPTRAASPQATYGGGHYLAPADFATIYDLTPVYQQALTGSGQTIAIVGRTNINLSDVQQFRSFFLLPANNPQIIVNGANPGIVNADEETEADLDVEWSGAVAKSATIDFVVSASTNSSDGVALSAQYIVNHNLAPVMSTSFGLCEAALGTSGNSFYNSLWEQAAAQGITVLVSSGDSGAAGCDASSATTASAGRGVNGLCSSPYSICVGGTQFNNAGNPSAYWASTNTAGTQGSALSYIPENVWNESAGSGLWASGGGASIIYVKPSWQTGAGVPADSHRDVPDVSLTAAGHDGYLIYQDGAMYVVGGTSAASPSFAGAVALIVQSTAARQGNANTALYTLANKQRSGGAAIFHDTTSGNNSVPGVTGFNAGAGYDLATGLGSVDASVMIEHWGDATAIPPLRVSGASNSLIVLLGKTAATNFAASGGTGSKITLAVSGLPSGITYTFAPASFASASGGTTALTLTAPASAKAGSYPLIIAATSAGASSTASLTLTAAPAPTFALSESLASASVPAGGTGSATLTSAPNSTFNATVSFQVAGMPSAMTAQFSPATIAAPGSGTTKLTLSSSSKVAAGAYPLTISANGGGLTETTKLTANVPGFSLSANASTVSVGPAGKGSVTISTHVAGGFSSALALSVSGLPAGVTASFSSQNVASPGSGSSTLTFTRSSSAKAGSTAVTVTGAGGNFTSTLALTLNLTAK